MNEQKIMPLFVFQRRRHIELEGGSILAGQPIVDNPKQAQLKARHKQMINSIVQKLGAEATSGRMPADALVLVRTARPANAVETSNDKVMAAWAKNSLVIGVRVDPHNDGFLRIDSDQLRQMGLSSGFARNTR
ncbi:hypothetical protein IVA95_22700 [Bradyrhizobium sp. 157]|uniref:hypothetical protein n=1 Tax=Bradyrhizobium sp. 157 TaxID=2782631 RepID=UPI001FF8E507|nr:hypothetical protein [Bradyrhizobium sp. 157]MCK1640339.1 hypothetical protein [Bradyrhizobium sp. 157]